MTTLEAIGFTAAGGSVIFALSFAVFGEAVRGQHSFIAPRCTSRPRQVIHNPSPDDPCQQRGHPMVGWISWATSLSYSTLLRGIPGTGTRNGGIDGSLLKVNLDGVILLRFHAVLARVTALATLLCVGVILPVNLSATCFNYDDSNATLTYICEGGTQYYNLTNFERTTLANIPALENPNSQSGENVFGSDISGTLGRLYAIVFCSWFVTMYTCSLLRREWVDVLAMRRVYYLEYDHWGERKKELQRTLLLEYQDNLRQAERNKFRRPRAKKENTAADPVLERDPWIPHPEQRETVPNVAIYSVLVGGLPAAPNEEVDDEDVEAAMGLSLQRKLDWQLSFASEYFDKCVPNQPGFSSSIAAITILPSANDLGVAWSKWYAAAAKLRRLRYIRQLIKSKVYYDIALDEVDNEDTDSAASGEAKLSDGSSLLRASSRERSSSEIYKDVDANKDYYRDVLGSSFDEADSSPLFLAFDFGGPEQTAVYSREFAQSAAACCPVGCCVGRLERAGIDELREMEQEAKAEVHAANLSLREAQHEAIVKKSLSKQSSSDSPQDLPNNSLLHLGPRVLPNSSSTVHEDDLWALVDAITGASINQSDRSRRRKRIPHADDGVPTMPRISRIFRRGLDESANAKNAVPTIAEKIADTFVRESTYAIVTFTSRQGATAARQCLADGRGFERWRQSRHIPVPPLADAAPWALCPCRGCCRPVTISISERQKLLRRYFVTLLLAAFYIFYTIPLTAVTSLVDPSRVDKIFPGYSAWLESRVFFSDLVTGIVPAGIWTLFFAVLPVLFKSLSNFGSNAIGVYSAENLALQYYWWFMVFTAFSGSSFVTMIINGFNEGVKIGSEAATVLRNIAATIPTVISSTWLNWILVRTTITLPLNYMMQVNTYLFHCLGWNCCSRVVRGGGPGGPVPYRIYIDSGVVFLCVVALAPASPLVAPAALLYFLYCWPLMRRNLIFMYRPKFDSGGRHWPFLFDMVISALVVGQILLTTMMALKKAIGPGIMAAIPLLPTFWFRLTSRQKFLNAFMDTSLYTTSALDGWDVEQPTSAEKREEFRRFLVDAHKAAYVPVCLANSEEILTAEPAMVVEHDLDDECLDEENDLPLPFSLQKSTFSPMPSSNNPGAGASRQASMRDLRERTFSFDSVASRHSRGSVHSTVPQHGASAYRVPTKRLSFHVMNDDGSVQFSTDFVPYDQASVASSGSPTHQSKTPERGMMLRSNSRKYE